MVDKNGKTYGPEREAYIPLLFKNFSPMIPPREFTDETLMPFGKFRGKPMREVPAPYLLWLFNNGCDHAGVRCYILNNLSNLKKYDLKK